MDSLISEGKETTEWAKISA